MNHYPVPGIVDKELETVARMQRVDIGREPTWRMVGSKSERLGRLAAFAARRPAESFDGQLDALLYRGSIVPVDTRVVDIASDHRAIVTEFEVE
jgi:endonuclease/exonuclease/phosphatase (EEP) superfamily protein YafD